MAVAYKVEIGGQTASSKATENERQLLALFVRLDMSGAGGWCEIRLGDPDNAPPGQGDAVKVELDNGSGSRRVFTGKVDGASIDATGQTITAYDGLRELAWLEVDAVYEDVDVDFVVKDLLGQAGATVGQVAKGFKLAAFRLKREPNALGHILQLADWCGADVYTDGEGKVHFTTPDEEGAEHSFQFKENVLRVDLKAMPPLYGGVEVYGEGSAGSQGAEKFYWLPKDLAGVSGKAAIDAEGSVSEGKSSNKARRMLLGAVRSGEAAGKIAKARLQALAARWLRGTLEVFGEPAVAPGDSVKLEGIPDGHALSSLLQGSHKLRVRAVNHRLSRNSGLVTRLEF